METHVPRAKHARTAPVQGERLLFVRRSTSAVWREYATRAPESAQTQIRQTERPATMEMHVHKLTLAKAELVSDRILLSALRWTNVMMRESVILQRGFAQIPIRRMERPATTETPARRLIPARMEPASVRILLFAPRSMTATLPVRAVAALVQTRRNPMAQRAPVERVVVHTAVLRVAIVAAAGRTSGVASDHVAEACVANSLTQNAVRASAMSE